MQECVVNQIHAWLAHEKKINLKFQHHHHECRGHGFHQTTFFGILVMLFHSYTAKTKNLKIENQIFPQI